ncbi:MAG: iron-containing alcohol dehydrogenase [Myxococcota bacterium]|nr:iron-containing alcohol dehydrogenase [Myxococcota bacterium]
MAFELATAARIVFGDGTVARLPALARELAPSDARGRAMVIVGRSVARHGALLGALDAVGLDVTTFSVSGEPTIEVARAGTEEARRARCTLVIAIGGGSVLDAGKAIAALAANDGEVLDYLEVIGRGKPLTQRSLPLIAVPTTAGTGSEVTKNAVLADPHERVKVSLRSEHMLPRIALIDPELTWSVPPDVTASTGLDALTQVLEPFVSIAASPLTDPFCREGMVRAARSLRRAFERGDDREARSDLALASLFGGIALANAKLGAVHGFAGPIGGSFESPHGAVCARLLPFVIEANVAALRARAPQSPVLARYDEVARLLTGREDACAEDAIAWTHELATALEIPPLREYGMRATDLDTVADKSARASSMKGNPIVLEKRELLAILERAL